MVDLPEEFKFDLKLTSNRFVFSDLIGLIKLYRIINFF
jgi:hypothetical protein